MIVPLKAAIIKLLLYVLYLYAYYYMYVSVLIANITNRYIMCIPFLLDSNSGILVLESTFLA